MDPEKVSTSKILDFCYVDSDLFLKEISEEKEFIQNKDAFYSFFGDKTWSTSYISEKDKFLQYMLDVIEQNDNLKRIQVLKSVLYLCQGCFKECHSEYDVEFMIKENCLLLYKRGYYSHILTLLQTEIYTSLSKYTDKDGHLETNQPIRLLISILYTMLEVMRNFRHEEFPEFCSAWKDFQEEFIDIHLVGKECILNQLFDLLNKFCTVYSPQIPVKRITLYIWKSILFACGGIDDCRCDKIQKFKRIYETTDETLPRGRFNADFLGENTSEIISRIKPFSFDTVPYTTLINMKPAPANRLLKVQIFTSGTSNTVLDQEVDTENNQNHDDNSQKEAEESEIKSQENLDSSGKERTPPAQFERNLLLSKKNYSVIEEKPKVNEEDHIVEVARDDSNEQFLFDDITESGVANVNSHEDTEYNHLLLPSNLNDTADSRNLDNDDIEDSNTIVDNVSLHQASTKFCTIDFKQQPEQIDTLVADSHDVVRATAERGGDGRCENDAPYSAAISEQEFADFQATGRQKYTEFSSATADIFDDDSRAFDGDMIQDPFESRDDTSDMNASTFSSHSFTSQRDKISSLTDKKLPWKSKVRRSDLSDYLNKAREKFMGFTLPNDITTLKGLPLPIHESFRILKNHLYVPLSEIECELEGKRNKYPFLYKEREIPQTPVEMIYVNLLPNMTAYMVSLLKILLAASPIPKPKAESVNIKNDVMPKDINTKSQHDLNLLECDIKRHKGVIAKAVTSILLLLLKHFKVNHIYQYEHCSLILSGANCLPLILKYLNQDLIPYLISENDRYYGKSINPETSDNEDNRFMSIPLYCDDRNHSLSCGEYNWRNLFTCVNLIRILNMLIKGKSSRIITLVVFGSAPILRKSLRVNSIVFQYYVLKLLKLQMKYLGRQWRKNNMFIVSAIYQCIRHHLLDDWAYGNYPDAKPWDFQNDEILLKNSVQIFHKRRYPHLIHAIHINERGKANSLPLKCGIGGNIGGVGCLKGAANNNNQFNFNLLDNQSFGINLGVNNNNMLESKDDEFGEVITAATTAVAGGYGGMTSEFNDKLLDVVSIPCLSLMDLLKFGQQIELTHEFKVKYKDWLNREVYGNKIQWETLLEPVL